MKTILILCAALAHTPLLPAATNLSSRIISKYQRPLFGLLFHDETPVLIVDGKRFENVRGGTNFYLSVPNTNAIIFVTEEKTPKYYMTFHFYSLDTKSDLKVNIGMGGPRPGSSQEQIASFTGTNICITLDAIGFRGARTQTRYNIDLSHQRFVSEEHLFFDMNGAVTNHDIFPKSR